MANVCGLKKNKVVSINHKLNQPWMQCCNISTPVLCYAVRTNHLGSALPFFIRICYYNFIVFCFSEGIYATTSRVN